MTPDYSITQALTTERVAGPEWARSLPIYQAFPHDFGDKTYQSGGYFRRTQALLPALKEMGVGIIWLVPVHPRGPAPGAVRPEGISKEAQFESDSPYCIRDYRGIDPRLGTPDDMKSLVRAAHELGMRIIMDFVPNHTSWGNPLLVEHPEFYKRDAAGLVEFVSPWKDIAQLDYSKREVWNYMRDILQFWVRDFDIDGFRMDVAGRMPIEWWQWLRPELEKVKPLFLLAEADEPRHHPSLDMTYNWSLPPILWALAKRGVDDEANKMDATAIDRWLQKEAVAYPVGAIRMNHLDNHDQHGDANAWVPGYGFPKNKIEGNTVLARSGLGLRPFSVLMATLPGKPLVYNGQELQIPNGPAAPVPTTPQQLRVAPNFDFYRRLLNTYQQQSALQSGDFLKIPSGRDATVYAFMRRDADSQVLVVLNLSNEVQDVSLLTPLLRGTYREIFSDAESHFDVTAAMHLNAWDYRVYVQR